MCTYKINFSTWGHLTSILYPKFIDVDQQEGILKYLDSLETCKDTSSCQCHMLSFMACADRFFQFLNSHLRVLFGLFMLLSVFHDLNQHDLEEIQNCVLHIITDDLLRL